MNKLTPYPHQLEANEWREDKPKVILALDMGLGKTAIAAMDIKRESRVLVICPATLKLNWAKELKTWADRPRIKIIKKKTDELPKGNGIVIINYDLLGQNIKKGKRKYAVANYDFKDFDEVILDESHFIKNSKAVRSKIAARIIKKAPKATLLTGTPMERPIDLYVPLFALGAVDCSYDSFGMKYGDPQQVYLGTKTVWQYRGSSNEEELKEILKPFMLRMLKEDVMDLPDKIVKVVSLDLPVSKREKQYDFSDIVKDPRPIAFEGLSELLKEHGIKKLPLAIKHIKMRLEQNHKIFVTAKHRDVIDTLMDKLKDFNPVKIDGRLTAEQKEEAKETFQNDISCRICVGQTRAAGTGLTLTAANHVVIVEPDWSYSALMQLIDRVHRIGQKETVTAELLTINESIDERVLFTTLEKKGFIDNIIGL